MPSPNPILNLIAKHESGPAAVKRQGVPSDYDVVWGGIPAGDRPQALHRRRLTEMTIAQVLEWQRAVVRRGAGSSAAGRYQIIRKTLVGVRAQEDVPESALFDAAMQDRLAVRLLRNRGWDALVQGKMEPADFADSLAREWASLPVQHDQDGASRPVKRGQSYYAGDGLNHASASPEDVMAAVLAAMAFGHTYAPMPPAEPAAAQLDLMAVIAELREQNRITDQRLAMLERFVHTVGTAAAIGFVIEQSNSRSA